MDPDNSDSQEQTLLRVNLHPAKRRQPKVETDILRSLKPSESQEDQTKSDEDVNCGARKKRQTLLEFSNGSLATKKPLSNPISRDDKRRRLLAEVAKETLLLLPGLLATRPDIANNGWKCQGETLDVKKCPKLPPIRVRVVDSDTIDAALDLQQLHAATSGKKPVVILNMANARTAGGGWKYGALAQEEAICYRTSLYSTLHHKHYPIPDDAAIYSPTVMVIRDSIIKGHNLLDFRNPSQLDIISVISCAAVCLPSVKKDANGLSTYVIASDRRMMMEKMRIILRTAIRNGHRQVVLGALGCGAFGNPNMQVAVMWKTVLQEQEFRGGYWQDIVFAVLGGSGSVGDNLKVFGNELDGLILQ